MVVAHGTGGCQVTNPGPTNAPGGQSDLAELHALWGGRLERIVPEAPEAAGRVPRTRHFLAEVGLPSVAPMELYFFRNDDGLFTLLEVDSAEYFAIGDDGGALLAVHSLSEELWWLNPADELSKRFVNSDLGAFLVPLGILAAAGTGGSAGTADRVRPYDEVERRLRAADPRALTSKDSWWVEVINQGRGLP
jgi:hypothetical protein